MGNSHLMWHSFLGGRIFKTNRLSQFWGAEFENHGYTELGWGLLALFWHLKSRFGGKLTFCNIFGLAMVICIWGLSLKIVCVQTVEVAFCFEIWVSNIIFVPYKHIEAFHVI